jgi:ankyrin repeat protein
METSSLHWFAVNPKSDATPLYLAALCGFQDLVEHLIVKYPQQVNTIGGHYVTPLVAALAGRHFQTAELLHQNGAHVNVHGKNGETALCSAAWYGDLEMVQLLLNLEADVNDRGFGNWTPRYNASQGPGPGISHISYYNPQLFPDVARLLLERGADVNARIENGSDDDPEGNTPLHTAADNGRVEVAHVLLECGANVGAEDNKGRTPLHVAAKHREVETVRLLLEHGANVRAEDNEGTSPLHIAAKFGKIEAVRMLLEHGANAGAEDNKGRTPFRMASAAGEEETMKLLLEHGAKGVYSLSMSSLCLP